MSLDVISNLDPEGGTKLFESNLANLIKRLTTRQLVGNGNSGIPTRSIAARIKLRNSMPATARPEGEHQPQAFVHLQPDPHHTE